MPELPEVETIRREVAAQVTGSRISGIAGSRPTIDLRDPVFRSVTKDSRITGTSRHGKYLFAALDSGPVMVFHFGMTGDLQHLGLDDSDPPYCRAAISFYDRSRLAFIDPRRFGRITIATDKASFLAGKRIGPDALSLKKDVIRQIIGKSRRRIKVLLLDQHQVAGIGNIYADEILFQSRIHPLRNTTDISTGEVNDLHKSIRSVLQKAISLAADFDRYPDTWLIPHRSPGQDCPLCGGRVDRMMVAGRYAYYCPSCQT
jgi:formamidopyrimidine-DNA glycosylase